MPQCAVVSCTNTHRKTKGGPVRYHRFPGDAATRARWVRACGRHVHNCATARVCSRHFTERNYEKDVQNELLGFPARCRLKRGAVPDANLPADIAREEEEARARDSAIAVLLAVGLVPAAPATAESKDKRIVGGLPLEWVVSWVIFRIACIVFSVAKMNGLWRKWICQKVYYRV